MKRINAPTVFTCMIVTILTCWLFWESVGRQFVKDYTESFIKTEYGHLIIQQSEDLKIIKEFEIYKEDDNGTGN